MSSKFYKIVLPNGNTFVVISNNGYVRLIDLAENFKDKEHTYIIPLTFFELVKYMLRM